MNLQEVECEGMEWIDLAQGQVAGTCKGNNELRGYIKCGKFFD